MSSDEVQNVKHFTFENEVTETDAKSSSQSFGGTKKVDYASPKKISPDDDGVYLSPKIEVDAIFSKEKLENGNDNVSDTSTESTISASFKEESVSPSKEDTNRQNRSQALTRLTKSKEQSVQDIYDGNHYCLARSSSVLCVDDSKSSLGDKDDVESTQTTSGKYCTKNKLWICLAFVNILLIGVVVHLLVVNQGNTF